MWPSATPATQSAAASRATKSGPSAPPSAVSATPATQNQGECEKMPRLPRETPRRHSRLKRAQVRHPVPWAPRLPRKTKADASKCHDKVACESWYVTKCVARLSRKVPHCDGMWQCGMWQRCVWSYLCDGWYATKLCVKFMYVTDGMRQSCVLSLCVKFMYVTDGMWQSCVLSLFVWSLCMWKMVCDKVVTDGM